MFSDVPLFRYLLNSVFVTCTIVACQVICNVLAAYVFARIQFPGRDALFLLYHRLHDVPGQVTLIRSMFS